jgi:hypothetical protein
VVAFSLLAAAVAFSGAAPLNAGAWFQGFPSHPKISPLQLIASEITVNKHGYTESCRATAVIGDASWAAFTCQLIRVNGLFRVAKINGHSAYGVYRLRNTWVQRGPAPSDLHVWDFEVPLTDPPADLELPALQKIEFVVS